MTVESAGSPHKVRGGAGCIGSHQSIRHPTETPPAVRNDLCGTAADIIYWAVPVQGPRTPESAKRGRPSSDPVLR